MAESLFKIPRASDRTILEVFSHAGQFDGTSVNQLHAQTLSGASVFAVIGEDPISKQLIEEDAFLIDQLLFKRPEGVRAIFYRGGAAAPKSPIWDEVKVQGPDDPNSPSAAIALRLASELQKKLSANVTGATGEPDEELRAVHGATLTRLELLNEELIRGSTAFRNDLERQAAEAAQKLDEEAKRQRAELEAEFASRSQKLGSREQALETKLKEIDDRDNTIVRRDIRAGMLKEVKERVQAFGVSEQTSKKRGAVRLALALLCVVLSVFMGATYFELRELGNYKQEVRKLARLEEQTTKFTSTEEAAGRAADLKRGLEVLSATSDPAEKYWLWSRLSLSALGLLASLLFLVRWENRWADQHASAEFNLQQFYLDVNRASWVLESCLEWRKETKSAIPSELLTSITRNLFVDHQQKSETVLHPADQLASALLGSASKVSVNTKSGTLEFDKPKKIPEEVKV